MRPATWKPEKVLRPALRRAEIVDGYTHVCRRKAAATPRNTPTPVSVIALSTG